MKILTINCHLFLEQDYLVKFRQITNFIKENDIDVVFLQELAIDLNNNHLIKDSLEFINQHLNYYQASQFVHYAWNRKYEERVAILSKYPLFDIKGQIVSTSQNHDDPNCRSVIKATINYHHQLIELASTHFGAISFNGEKIDDSVGKQFMNYFNDPFKGLRIIGGDFNCEQNTHDYEMITKHYYDLYGKQTNLEQGYTICEQIDGWSDNIAKRRIDYIMANQPLEVIEMKPVFDQIRVSDHFGYYLYINI